MRYSDALRYDAWKWLRMIQPEENNEDNPVYHLEVKKNRFGVIPKSVRQLYRVGDRLLTDAEWVEYNKTNKGKSECHSRSTPAQTAFTSRAKPSAWTKVSISQSTAQTA